MARPPNPDARQAMELAARRAFAEVGVDGARVEDIARAAGLSKASFYVYFESKDSLFLQLATEFFQVCQQCADQQHSELAALHQRIGTCDARDWALRTPRFQAYSAVDHDYTQRFLRILWEWRDVLQSLLEHASEPHRQLVDGFVAATQQMVAGRLDEAVRKGFLRQDIDPDLASEIVIGAYLQLGRRMFRLADPPDFDRWARNVETVINEGLRPREE